MLKIRTISGLNKVWINTKIKIYVFFYFFIKFLKGKLKFIELVNTLRRLSFFLSKLQHNKFIKIGNQIKLDLYVPAFPSKAFFTACNKFAVFNEKLPCTTVLLSVTSACHYNCSHCYQKYDKGKNIDIDRLLEVVSILQNKGIAFFNIEGGEPFLAYDRLKKVCEKISDSSEIWINSTGDGITYERLLELKKRNVTAIMFSLHSPDIEDINNFFGNELAWEKMTSAIDLCHKADISVAINSCLNKEAFMDGTFEKIMDLSRKFNASIIQLIKPKPAGGFLEKNLADYDNEDFEFIKRKVNLYNNDENYRDFPAISAQIIEEDRDLFGCTAGGTDRFYINAKGDVQPCEFLNISFGNIEKENFEDIYKKMRDYFEMPGICWLCEKYSKYVLQLKKENNLEQLPLAPDLSEKILEIMDRGEETPLYKKIKKMSTNGGK